MNDLPGSILTEEQVSTQTPNRYFPKDVPSPHLVGVSVSFLTAILVMQLPGFVASGLLSFVLPRTVLGFYYSFLNGKMGKLLHIVEFCLWN